jgi:peptidyl-prolyl cis-trans isomerase B (cyclophilin B)
MIRSLIVSSLAVLLASASLAPSAAAEEAAPTKNPVAVVETSKGVFEVELDQAKAPKSTANFVEYAEAGFYDGTTFHRVIPGFMIQGGGYGPGMQKKETKAPIPNEADNGLKNTKGTVAMARTNDPNSATSQFFVNVKDNGFLDHTAKTPAGWGYAVFGKVTKGMDVVETIETVKTTSKDGMRDVPVEDVIIEKVTIKK